MSRIQKSILKSGIGVITEEMPEVESSSIGIWINTGSINETRDINGISHFIEHLLFKGTSKRNALDISKEIESVGGVLNAFTSREYTCFYSKVLNKDLSKAIDLLSDMFLNSKFDKSELEKEKMVVLQEIKMVDDTPDDLIHDLFAARFWEGHPLGWPVLGSAKTIKSMTRADILAYYRNRYNSKNSFITMAGGLKHAGAVKLLDKILGETRHGAAGTDVQKPLPTPGVKLYKKSLEQVHLCIGFPVPPQSHSDRYKTYLMNTVLGGGMSSRLFQQIREKRGLAYSVYSYLNLCKDTGALTAYAGTSKESFTEVLRLVLREFGALRKGVSAEELRNAKEQLKGGMLLGLETSDNRMMKLARDEIYFGKFVPVREIVKGIDSVKANDIKDMAKRLISIDRLTMVAMGAVGSKDIPQSLRKLL